MRYLSSALCLIGVLVFAGPSFGDNSETVVPAGGGQPILVARLVGTRLLYRTCDQAPCSPAETDSAIDLPQSASGGLAVDVLSIGLGRHALYAHVSAFAAIVVAPVGSGPARVVFSGPTGATKGEPGERHGDVVQVSEPDSTGVVRVLVGEEREDIHICGRPSILSPRVLDARDLSLKGAIVQRLAREERESAPVVDAARVNGEPPPALGRLLQASGASSAIGEPAALTDGDPHSTWAEHRGGDGRGEFVQMNAPEDVEIRSLSFLVRPADRDLKNGVAPKKIWLASTDSLLGVNFPEDAWAHPGAWYDVKLPSPWRTRCVAIVLDEAYARGHASDAEVTLTEVVAHTEFDDHPNYEALAGALAGGKARSHMAASILTRAGMPGFQAAIEAYPKLDGAGRVLALEVVDSAPCETSAPLYAKALETGAPGEVHHALDRIARCGREAAPPLLASLVSAPAAKKGLFANVLAHTAPDLAVRKIVELSATAPRTIRTEFRAALAHATQSEAAGDAVRAELADTSLAPVATIDLLRSVHVRSDLLQPLGDAVSRVGSGSPDFRTRYLLLGPAASLAASGEPRAEAFVSRALSSDADPNVRARAAEAASAIPKLGDGLLRAASDPEPRVREAALAAISKGGAPLLSRAVPAMTERLRSEPWTFVRLRAVEGLAAAPAGETVDGPLAAAIDHEPSPRVRTRLVEALGRHAARAHADAIRERLEDRQEDMEVRTTAARALGRLCDPKDVDALTQYTRLAVAPGADPAAMALGASAAAALIALSPRDLDARLAPLEDPTAPAPLRDAVKAARSAPQRCAR